jgi:hypothetical protein
MKNLIAVFLFSITFSGCAQQKETKKIKNSSPIEKIEKTETQWKSELSEFEYYVLREKGTERAFTGALLSNKEEGLYVCAACSLPL